MWRLYREAGLSRAAALHWNAVPWYVGEDGKGKAPTKGDLNSGVPWLHRLIDLLPELRLVVAMGAVAGKSMELYAARYGERLPAWVPVAHPSPRVKAGNPHRWRDIQAVFSRAARVAGRETTSG